VRLTSRNGQSFTNVSGPVTDALRVSDPGRTGRRSHRHQRSGGSNFEALVGATKAPLNGGARDAYWMGLPTTTLNTLGVICRLVSDRPNSATGLRSRTLRPAHVFRRFFIEGGLAVAVFGLLPGALSLTGLADSTIWRVSSAAAAFMFSVYLVFLFGRRRRLTPSPIQLQTSVAFASSIMGTLALWVNTVGFRFQPSAAAYALPLTWLLLVGGWVFVQNLGLFFGEAPSR